MISINKTATAIFALAWAASIAEGALCARAQESTKAVVIESYSFSPSHLKVKKGTQVSFVNKDAAPHTVTPFNKDDFVGTGRLLKDDTKTIVFDHVGKIRYFCDFHPSMEGSVTVTDN